MERNREEEIANANMLRSTTTRTGSSGSRESKVNNSRETSKSNFVKRNKKSGELKEEANNLRISKQKTSGDLSGKSRLVKTQSADAGMSSDKNYLLGQDFIPSI